MAKYRRSSSKFNVDHSAFGKIARTIDGILFASKAEAGRYATLKQMVRAGEIYDLRQGESRDLVVNGTKVGAYTPDFEYKTPTGNLVIEEVKSGTSGKESVYRLRKKVFEACTGLVVSEFIK